MVNFKDQLEILYLSEKEVKTCLPSVEKTVKMMEEVFIAHCQKKVQMPAKVSLLPKKEIYHGHINVMPAYLEDIDIAGVKIMSGYENNREKNLPSALGTINLFDSSTGCPIAIMGGKYITSLRTGAVTGVFAKYLARKNSKIMGIIGAGDVSPYHIYGVSEVINLEEIKIFDISRESAEKVANKISKEIKIKVSVQNSCRETVNKADIIVTCTRLAKPASLVKKEWLKEGAFIITTGSMVEIDYELLKNVDKLIVDNKTQMKNETPHRGFVLLFSGDKDLGIPKIYSWDDIYSDIGEVVLGRKKGRETEKENILGFSLGMGSEDLIVSHFVYNEAKKRKLGTSLNLF